MTMHRRLDAMAWYGRRIEADTNVCWWWNTPGLSILEGDISWTRRGTKPTTLMLTWHRRELKDEITAGSYLPQYWYFKGLAPKTFNEIANAIFDLFIASERVSPNKASLEPMVVWTTFVEELDVFFARHQRALVADNESNTWLYHTKLIVREPVGCHIWPF